MKKGYCSIILFVFALVLQSCLSSTKPVYGFAAGPWLTWSEDPTISVTVNWVSAVKRHGEVIYGKSSDNLEFSARGETSTTTQNIVLSGLEPGTEYFYKIVRSGAGVDGGVHRFKTAPVAGEPADFTFAVVGDWQPMPIIRNRSNRLVADAVEEINPDFVCQIGDVTGHGGLSLTWGPALRILPKMVANRPFLSAIGNHDYWDDGHAHFARFFSYPYQTKTEERGKFYHVDYADVRMIFLDNFDKELSGQMSDFQKDWAESLLREAYNDEKIKWTFVFMHHTMLTTGTSGRNVDLQKWIVPLASKYKVDGIFFGHDHHYEHWEYQYGKSGYLYEEGDLPAEDPLYLWCIGGGGAKLEISFNLLERGIGDDSIEWFNIKTGKMEKIQSYRRPWNPERYIDHTSDKNGYGQAKYSGKNYYHAPDIESYADDNNIYGYVYGEQADHYVKIEVKKEGRCQISVHYPNHELLSGPDGRYPQKWEFVK
ncbi:MAG: metallophosphoesterase family protein [Spirochaetales bacterium]|nr:metallophosphoesterase family protein [Spirochaetales bacterium]